MKVAILCDGQGTRLREETEYRPKRIEKYIDRDTFPLTYGDGISSVNARELPKWQCQPNVIASTARVDP